MLSQTQQLDDESSTNLRGDDTHINPTSTSIATSTLNSNNVAEHDEEFAGGSIRNPDNINVESNIHNNILQHINTSTLNNTDNQHNNSKENICKNVSTTNTTNLSNPKNVTNFGNNSNCSLNKNNTSHHTIHATKSNNIYHVHHNNSNNNRTTTTTITHIINANPSFRLFTLESHYANKQRQKQSLEARKQQKAENREKKSAARLRRKKFQKDREAKEKEGYRSETEELTEQQQYQQQYAEQLQSDETILEQQNQQQQRQQQRNIEILSSGNNHLNLLLNDKTSNNTFNISKASSTNKLAVSGLFNTSKSSNSKPSSSAIKSLIAIPNLVANEPQYSVKEQQEQQLDTYSPTKRPDESQEEEDKIKPHPGLEGGKKLSKKLGVFPPELFGKPIEEMDEYYKDKDVGACFVFGMHLIHYCCKILF